MERSQSRQTPAHLLGIAEVEGPAHALAVLLFGCGASVGVGLPEGVCVIGQPLIRPGRYEVEVFIEDDGLVPGGCGVRWLRLVQPQAMGAQGQRLTRFRTARTARPKRIGSVTRDTISM
jgi:hypothetical protein